MLQTDTLSICSPLRCFTDIQFILIPMCPAQYFKNTLHNYRVYLNFFAFVEANEETRARIVACFFFEFQRGKTENRTSFAKNKIIMTLTVV